MKRKTEVNKIILEKIGKSDAENKIKSFLKDILDWENEHSEETRPRFREDFYKLIVKYTKTRISE